MVQIERLTEGTHLGEAPHWDQETQTVYFVDILGMKIFQYSPSTQKLCKASVGLNLVSFVIPVEGEKHQFIVSLGRQIVRIFWNSETEDVRVIEQIAEVEDSLEFSDNRFNDGKCDPVGRLWAGTLNMVPEGYLRYPPKGTLYSISQDREVKEHLSKIRISNGIAFDQKAKFMYHIDSCKGTIDRYDFDLASGTISDGKAVFTLEKHSIDGIMDGMTIDSDGNLWVAIFNGSRIIKVDPKKPETLLDTVQMPVKQITSLTFGGPNLDELYVTTASYKLDNDEHLPRPENGALYRVTGLGSKGLPAHNFRIVNI